MTEEPRQGNGDAQRNKHEGISPLVVIIAALAVAVPIVIGLWAFIGPSTPTQKKDLVQAVGILFAGRSRRVVLHGKEPKTD
jgi:hypothetical protein